ncbi:MAG: hypothetical protein UR98_C0003G0078 [Parcubacteria group bacterium GW2011_GWA1_36_12]|nr:MAG: hypothetical protein UR98_C0003G0078 [Parcubacteria group bacterium GW2011_GWA1_36_12]
MASFKKMPSSFSKNTSKFQSFLIVGKGAKEQTIKLAKEFNIDLEKPSPDISIISPQKKFISINQIREIKATIYQKPVAGKYKIIIIHSAEKLTTQAQNSLLKIFEEPPSHAIIILEAADKSNLLPTIVSRAIVIRTSAKSDIGKNASILLSGKDTYALLKTISVIEDPSIWLDEQMNTLHQSLLTNIKHKKSTNSLDEIQFVLEKCAEAKKMIGANVDGKFVLSNLIFSLNLNADN